MKFLLVFILCVNFGHSQEAGEGGGDGGDASFVHPDQFLNQLVNGYFKCGDMCSSQPAFVGYQQSEFVGQLNRQWIRHMEHKLNQWGYELKQPPPIHVNVFDQPLGQERLDKRYVSEKSDEEKAQSKLNQEQGIYAPPGPLHPDVMKHDYMHIGRVFGYSLRSSLDEMNAFAQMGRDMKEMNFMGVHSNDLIEEFQAIPKIEGKDDVKAAIAKTDETESNRFFIFFHNEADHTNRHIKDYVELKNKYSNMANFYRTDTGFALVWAEKFEIHRMFDTIVAVHPQADYVVRNDNPTLREKMNAPKKFGQTTNPQFVQLQSGTFEEFTRLHLNLGEEEDTSMEFPHVSVD